MRRTALCLLFASPTFLAGCVGPMHKAARDGDTERVLALLESGGDREKCGVCAAKGTGYVTPLGCAAYGGHIETMKALLARGVEVGKDCGNLWHHPIGLAAQEGHTAAVKLFIEHGADPNQRVDFHNQTALTYATLADNEELVKLLLDAGADPNLTDSFGRSPLSYARWRGSFMVRKLIEAAAAERVAALRRGATAAGSPRPPFTPSASAKPEPPPDAVPASPAVKTAASDADQPTYRFAENPDNFALVIGIEKYAGLPVADHAERDAAAVREHLSALGYPARNIIYLTGSQASKAGLEKYLEAWLPRNLRETSKLFVYFSGHGAPDIQTGEAYLVPQDGDAKFIETTGYSVSRLYEKLNSLKARHIIVAMDACFSGTGGRSVLPKGARPLVTKIDTGADRAGRLTVLAAAGPDEITGTEESQGHGLFTHHLLHALNQAQGSITVKSLYDDLLPRVQDAARRDNRDQTPQFLHPPGGDAAGLSLR